MPPTYSLGTPTIPCFPDWERRTPAGLEELAELVRQAASSRTPVYPIGGGTSLMYGGRPRGAGWAVSLQQLCRVVDYPARDLTITVEAGLPVADLQALLAQQGQRWAVDVPQPDRATVGGLVACNLSGPRRFAYGSVGESVLAATAVDGQGMIFSAGARVVKNAAGYNLCRLLAGSVGTLAVLAQLTLRVQPLPETTAFVVARLEDWDRTERVLAWLMQGRVLPTALELAAGPAWAADPLLGPLRPPAKGWLLVGLEGSAKQVAWQLAEIQSAWRQEGLREVQTFGPPQAELLWRRLTEFPVLPGWDDAEANGLPPSRPVSSRLQEERFLVAQASLLPGRVVGLVSRWLKMDAGVSVLAHAGHGSLIGYFPLSAMDGRRCIRELIFPSVEDQGGYAQVLLAPTDVPFAPTDLWSRSPAADPLMQALKRQFDPYGILNPGRWGFGVQ